MPPVSQCELPATSGTGTIPAAFPDASRDSEQAHPPQRQTERDKHRTQQAEKQQTENSTTKRQVYTLQRKKALTFVEYLLTVYI